MRADFLRVVSCLFLAVGCAGANTNTDASPTPPTDGPPVDVPGQVPGNPRLGAHALAYYAQGAAGGALMTSPTATQSTGSTIVVSVGRGILAESKLPTDNKGNSPYQQIDTDHAYEPSYPNSGTALYAFASAKGGADFQVSTNNADGDETTLAFVEVIDGKRVEDYSWKMAETAKTVTSDGVATTGPATLVAFWWGDANQYFDKQAVPGDGFTRVDSILKEGSLVQCAVAVKNVTEAGTYTVSWTADPVQGAQLWLVAVQ